MRSSFVGVVVLTLLAMSDTARAAPGDPETTDIEGGDEVASGVAFNGFNGKIVLTGFTKPHPGVTHNEFATARYDSALIPDPEFDLDGKARVDFVEGAFAEDVAIDSSLRIVQVGSVNAGSGDTDFALTRFRPTDGYYDNTFAGGGKQVTARSGVQQANAVAIQSDNKIVVAGLTGPPGDFNFAVVRYTSGGSPDTTWAPDGWRETDLGGSMDIANDVAIQPDGKVVVAGQSGGGFTLVRYKPDGTLDTSFSGDGKQTTDLGGNDIAQGVALQSDGKIVLAGYQGSPYGADNKFALARYEGGGAPPVVVPVDPFPLPPIPIPPVPAPPGVSTTGTSGPDVFTGTVGRDVSARGRATTACAAARPATCSAARRAMTRSTARRARTSSTGTPAPG